MLVQDLSIFFFQNYLLLIFIVKKFIESSQISWHFIYVHFIYLPRFNPKGVHVHLLPDNDVCNWLKSKMMFTKVWHVWLALNVPGIFLLTVALWFSLFTHAYSIACFRRTHKPLNFFYPPSVCPPNCAHPCTLCTKHRLHVQGLAMCFSSNNLKSFPTFGTCFCAF